MTCEDQDEIEEVNVKKGKDYDTSPKIMQSSSSQKALTIEDVIASISNFQASTLNPPSEKIVLTPRSTEACLKCGIAIETLKIRDLNSFKEGDLDITIQKMRHEAYSQRREEQIKLVRDQRQQIIEKAKMLNLKASSPKKKTALDDGLLPSAVTSIEIEKRRIEKVQRRQQREIEKMLEFELKMSQIQEEATRKIAEANLLEEKREKEREMRAKQMAEERRQRELQKKMIEDAEEEKRKLLASEMFQKEKELLELRHRQELLRKIEARNRDEERNKKTELHRQQTEAILKKQQDEIMQKMKELEDAEIARNEMLEKQRLERAQQIEEKRKTVEKRIKKNLIKARQTEELRKQEFLLKQKQSEELRVIMEAQQEEMRKLQKEQAEMLEKKRQLVLQETKKEEEQRKQDLLRKQQEMDEAVARIKETNIRSLQLRKEQKKIEKQLKGDNVERIRRISEYKRLETLKKLHEDEKRTEKMLKVKQKLIQQRKESSIISKIQRDSILRTMEDVKVTKKWRKASKSLEDITSSNILANCSSTTKLGSPLSARSIGERSGSLPSLRSKTPKVTSKVTSKVLEHLSQSSPSSNSRHHLKLAKAAIVHLSTTPNTFLSPYEIPPEVFVKGKKTKKKRKQ